MRKINEVQSSRKENADLLLTVSQHEAEIARLNSIIKSKNETLYSIQVAYDDLKRKTEIVSTSKEDFQTIAVNLSKAIRNMNDEY